MAKESVKARQRKREAMVAKYAEKRAALKAAGDYKALDLLAKECISGSFEKPLPVTGRPRGYIRYFGVSRMIFRDMALQGKIPGVRKASW